MNSLTQGDAASQSGWNRGRWLKCSSWSIAGLVLALCVHVSLSPERETFLWMNQLADLGPPQFWAMLTMLGDTAVLLCVMAPLLLWRPQVLVALLAAIPVGGLASVLLKRLFAAPRPAELLDPASFHIIGERLGAHSFPSGHSITAFGAAAVVWACIGLARHSWPFRALAFGSLFLASMVGLSRIVMGAHWPVDVLAGAGIGWLAGLSGAFITRRWPHLYATRRSLWVVTGLLIVVNVAVLATHPWLGQGSAVVWLGAVCVWATLLMKLRQAQQPVQAWVA